MLNVLIIGLFFVIGNLLAHPYGSRLRFQLFFYNVFCFFVFISDCSVFFDFVSLDTGAAVFLLTVNFILFFVLSFVDLCVPVKAKSVSACGLSKFDYSIASLLIVVVVVSIYYKLGDYSFLYIFHNILRDDFINAYLLYFLIFFSAFLFYNGKTKIDALLAVFCLFLCFLLGVKGIVLLILLVYVIRLLDSNFEVDKKTKLKMLMVVVVGVISFYSSYVVPRLLFENEDFFDIVYDINQRFIFYAASGVLSFSIDYTDGVNMNNFSSLYVPFYNGYINLIEDGSDKVSYMVNLNKSIAASGTDSYSNVKTLYGTIYLNSGDHKTLNFAICFIFNAFLIVFRRRFNQRLKYTNSACTMYLACLLISWFEYYYWHAFFLYGVIYAFLLDFWFYVVSYFKR